jgi:GrpB-like predicted nucleotidyltransferase (UPF0157 family)
VNHWPKWTTEQVTLGPSEGAWSELGEREARLLDKALAGWLLAPVEHVGSTSVPGLIAKPILDLQAAVADLDECALLIAMVLAHYGWEYVPPDLDHRPWRRLFVQVIDGHRSAHLHVMTPKCPRWNQQLVFRDALRAESGTPGEVCRAETDLGNPPRWRSRVILSSEGRLRSRCAQSLE